MATISQYRGKWKCQVRKTGSRLFERGLNVIEVARITGHVTLSMLDRYTHLDVQGLVQKLG
jgi:site-specific recombinase XerD